VYSLQATVEQRKLAVDLAEVIVKWECQRMKEDSDDAVPQVNTHSVVPLYFHFVLLDRAL